MAPCWFPWAGWHWNTFTWCNASCTRIAPASRLPADRAGGALMGRSQQQHSKCENKSLQCWTTSVVIFFFFFLFKVAWLFQLSPWNAKANTEWRLTGRLHILRLSIVIVSCVLSRPYSWSLAVDTSTHSLFSLLSSLSMFSNVIMMTSNVVRTEKTRLLLCYRLLNGTDRRAHQHAAISPTHGHSFTHDPSRSHTLLIVSSLSPSPALTTHHWLD